MVVLNTHLLLKIVKMCADVVDVFCKFKKSVLNGYAINEENRARISLENKRILSIELGENVQQPTKSKRTLKMAFLYKLAILDKISYREIIY